MRFRPPIFIAFVFASFFFKFYNNGGNQKLKAWSFQLRKNYFCMLNIEYPIARQSSITIFLIHPVYCTSNDLTVHNNFSKIILDFKGDQHKKHKNAETK